MLGISFLGWTGARCGAPRRVTPAAHAAPRRSAVQHPGLGLRRQVPVRPADGLYRLEHGARLTHPVVTRPCTPLPPPWRSARVARPSRPRGLPAPPRLGRSRRRSGAPAVARLRCEARASALARPDGWSASTAAATPVARQRRIRVPCTLADASAAPLLRSLRSAGALPHRSGAGRQVLAVHDHVARWPLPGDVPGTDRRAGCVLRILHLQLPARSDACAIRFAARSPQAGLLRQLGESCPVRPRCRTTASPTDGNALLGAR